MRKKMKDHFFANQNGTLFLVDYKRENLFGHLFISAEETLPSGTLYVFKNRVILTSDGECTWYAPTILRSGCNIDITYFPFDDQLCELKFGSWTYNGLEVNVVQMSDRADLKQYMTSSEFELISAKAQRNVITYR